MSLFIDRGAVFSDCRQYRYRLWRIWDDSRPPAAFVMLNPSTADEVDNDQTVERCERRAHAMGFGGLQVVNIFALRSTDPTALYSHAEPIGRDNNAAIIEATREAGIVICAWGTHGNLNNRGAEVKAILDRSGIEPHCLVLNANGTPKHPLYVGYDVMPKPWRE